MILIARTLQIPTGVIPGKRSRGQQMKKTLKKTMTCLFVVALLELMGSAAMPAVT